MRLVSINLNKRMANLRRRCMLLDWLAPLNATMVAVQEATSAGTPIPETLGNFHLVGGNEEVALWSSQTGITSQELLAIPAISVELDNIIVCNTYLSADNGAKRAQQIDQLRLSLIRYSKPVLVVGDFNLAPMPMDGLYGDAPSTWTSAAERIALSRFMMELELVDLTDSCRVNAQHFTFERINKGKWTRFRCDLAFAHKALGFAARYDHSVRQGSNAFTDHSACIVEGVEFAVRISRSSPPYKIQPPDKPVKVVSTIRPENTAMRRSRPSKPVSALVKSGYLLEWHVKSILDFGCSYGTDITYLRGLGFYVGGYDPHPPFGFSMVPHGTYDLIVLSFVLNVLPSAAERLATIVSAARHLKPGARLFTVARSATEIEGEARKKNWERHADGYLSSVSKGTFQHGLSRVELIELLRKARLTVVADARVDVGKSIYAFATNA